MPSKLISFSIVIVSAVIVWLYSTGSLTLYIHPRYTVFTLLLSLLGGIIVFADFLMHTPYKLPRSTVLIVLLAVVAVSLPPQSLSAQLAGTRAQSSGSSAVILQSSVDAFSSDLTRFDIRDWDAFLRSSPDPNSVIGKKATVDGFLYRKQNQLFLARYQLTCCAVDATPLVLPLRLNEIDITQPDGTWFRAEGTMIAVPDSEYPLQLQPTLLTEIAEPEVPYVF